ncbi:hypothetical protein DL770_005198 [Monosporascus sp. CRB-9-2]|nr:hypothetical protein DL770_005198 [Monosporascus sp. CRB-9-2]
MPETIAIIGASGKLGGATLSALLSHKLAPPESVVALTSAAEGSDKWASLAARGVRVRHARYEDPASLEAALAGVHTFFLVSTPELALDLTEADGTPLGPGREARHFAAVDAAARVGVRRLVYSSLAFASGAGGRRGAAEGGFGGVGGGESKAGVMRAHLRTEEYLRRAAEERRFDEVVAAREGVYSESWPLYLGYFSPRGWDDERAAVKLAGDGKICWTAIRDLGVANALVLAAPPGRYAGFHAFYLSTRPRTAKDLKEVAALVGEARGREVAVEIVGRREHERHYIEDRGMDGPAVRWWASTYDALEAWECVVDDPTLEELLNSVGEKPTPFEDAVRAMVKKSD